MIPHRLQTLIITAFEAVRIAGQITRQRGETMNNEHQTEDQVVETEVEEVIEDDEFQAPAVVESLQNRLQLAGITPDTLGKYLYTL